MRAPPFKQYFTYSGLLVLIPSFSCFSRTTDVSRDTGSAFMGRDGSDNCLTNSGFPQSVQRREVATDPSHCYSAVRSACFIDGGGGGVRGDLKYFPLSFQFIHGTGSKSAIIPATVGCCFYSEVWFIAGTTGAVFGSKSCVLRCLFVCLFVCSIQRSGLYHNNYYVGITRNFSDYVREFDRKLCIKLEGGQKWSFSLTG